MHAFTQKVAAAILTMGIAGCAVFEIPEAKDIKGADPQLAERPGNEETVRGTSDPAVVTLDIGSNLREHRLKEVEPLPGNIIIPTTNLTAVPITAALQGVLAGTDVSLSWDTGSLGTRLVTVMNLSGPLPRVVEKICSAAKVFCNYRHGSVELSEKETFVVGLPPIARQLNSNGSAASGSTNSMVEAINGLLTGDKAMADEQGGTIIYTTDVEGEERVSRYLTELRTGRPLVVLQMYIWEVTLSKDNAQGINWSSFKFNNLDLSATNNLTSLASSTGSVSLGAVTTGVFSSSTVASFLATKGKVQTISNPQVTFVSGTNAQLKVGGTQRYISQVGTNLTTASGTSTSSSTNTVSTDTIDTGLTVDVAGSFENGVVFANLELALKNLVSLNPTTSGGQTIDLPETTDEKISTVLRVRPGDSLVLAGLVSSNATNDSQGVPLFSDATVPLYGSASRTNRELVVIVKPSVVLFSDKKVVETAEKKAADKPLPDAVVIDKDGAKTLVLPKTARVAPVSVAPVAAATAPAPAASAVSDASAAAAVATATEAPASLMAATSMPELMNFDPYATTTQDIPLAASNDGAPVDKKLMQRGFSRAYDQLLRPAAGSASGGGY